MKIKKVLNSSVVLVEDNLSNEYILLGKGIGYGQKPGNALEESTDNQVFIPIDNDKSKQLIEIINSLPKEIIEVTQEIIVDARKTLGTTFNDNLIFVLADHLNFAIERSQKNMIITNRVFWEIKNYYPLEFEAGLRAIDLVNENLGIILPEEEAANIAFHFANAQSSDNPNYDTAKYAKLTGEIINLVRYSLNRDFDKESIHYVRFVTHIKFFVERFFMNKLLHNDNKLLYNQMVEAYPKEMLIAKKVRDYLYEKYEQDLTDEELTFLVIHIVRLESN
ncbi:MAG: PRD domain-containing protein [Anaerorhabdus sp.]|uniref:PRD domain-containing protein n=1 Tax=Anaerorhabdus sp. TaxID=1872524 RepID=UPI003A874665